MSLKTTLLLIPLLPLAAAVIAGLLRKQVGRAGSHWVAILGRGGFIPVVCLGFVPTDFQGMQTQNISIYTWMVSDGIRFELVS